MARFERADISPERERDLDILAWQLAVQVRELRTAELRYVSDEWSVVISRWIERDEASRGAKVRHFRIVENDSSEGAPARPISDVQAQ